MKRRSRRERECRPILPEGEIIAVFPSDRTSRCRRSRTTRRAAAAPNPCRLSLYESPYPPSLSLFRYTRRHLVSTTAAIPTGTVTVVVPAAAAILTGLAAVVVPAVRAPVVVAVIVVVTVVATASAAMPH